MPTKKDLNEELDFLTGMLSAQARTTSLGILVFVWGLLVSDSAFAEDLKRRFARQLIATALLAIGVIFCDFLQYLSGYKLVRGTQLQMESSRGDEIQYDLDSWYYTLRLFFFWAKIFLLMVATIALIALVGDWIVHAILQPTQAGV